MTLLGRLRQVCGDTTRYYVNPDGPEAADEIERLREALHEFVIYGCPVCHGDCSSANPYVSGCPMTKGRSALQQKESE